MRASLTPKHLVIEDVRTKIQREVLSSLGGKQVVPGSFTLPRTYASIEQIRRRFPNDLGMTNDVVRLVWDRECQVNYDDRLFPYQNNGVGFLTSRDGILSFAPGLGKTATSIVAADAIKAEKILVVTILTLLPTWRHEIKKWTRGNDSTQEVRGRQGKFDSRWFVTNYDFFTRNVDLFERKWDLIIVDESIMIKNRDTKRFKALKKIRSKTKRLWLLSGAPITRDISDLWSQLNLINPSGFSSYWRFVNEYCIVQETNFGTVVVGSNPAIEPREDFSDILLSVSKEEAGLNIPDLAYETVWVEMTKRQRQVYDKVLDEFILDLGSRQVPVASKIAQLVRLCQVASSLGTVSSEPDSAKLDALRGLVREGMIQTPCIIWTRFIATTTQIYDMLVGEEQDVEMIMGETTEEERAAILDRFRANGLDFLIMGVSVGKYGLTLTNAWTMIYFDLTYNFDDLLQSVNRVHRIGLDHTPVVMKLVTTDSIEARIIDNLADKSFSLERLTNDQLIKDFLT